MKNRAFGGKWILAIILTVLGFVPTFFLHALTISPVYAAVETTSSFYYNGSVVEENVLAGETLGYGEFILGHENTVLEAFANEGFNIVGWQVEYLETDLATGVVRGEKEIVTAAGTTNLKTKTGTTVSAEIELVDDNNDGDFESSKFTLTRVFENLKVVPLYDYTYYNLDISSFASLFNYANYIEEDNVKIYYSKLNSLTEEMVYFNAIVEKEGKQYYYGNLYFNDVDGYYTKHGARKVPYEKGAFTLGQNVEIVHELIIDADDVYSSQYIELLGFTFNGTKLLLNTTGTEIVNTYTRVRDDDVLNTTEFAVNINIQNVLSKENVLQMDFNELKIASVDVWVDETDLAETNSVAKMILSVVKVDNEFANLGDGLFLVRKSEDSGVALLVNCADNYTHNGYYYYQFESLDGGNDKFKRYTDISDDFKIVAKYISVEYLVEFVFVDISHGSFIQNSNLGNIEPISLIRGEGFDSATAVGFEVPANVGYSFEGYTTEANANNLLNEVSVKINNEKPENVKIYICYEMIDYKLVVANINTNTLVNDQTIIYATQTLTYYKNNQVESVLDNSSLLESSPIGTSFELGTINIGDKVGFSSIVNKGFENHKYCLAEGGDYLEANEMTFDGDFIAQNPTLLANETLIIYVQEIYTSYTVTYSTSPTFNGEEDVIMATISLQNVPDGAVVSFYDGEILVDAVVAEYNKIIISNIKLYSNLSLLSEGKVIKQGSDARYAFSYFTEDDKTTFEATMVDATTNAYKLDLEKLVRDMTIKVVYARPGTYLNVTYNEEALTQSEAIIVTQNGEIPEKSGDLFEIKTGADFTVSFDSNEINFGYQFVRFSLLIGGVEQLLSGDEFEENISDAIKTYKLKNVLQVATHTLIIEFVTTKYNLYVNQNGAGLINENVQFDNDGDGTKESDYLQLDVLNMGIEFTKPEGYYVGLVTFAFNPELNLDLQTDMTESNDLRHNKDKNIYSFNVLTKALLESIVENNAQGNQILIRIEYYIYTYSVDVTYNIANAKNNYKDDSVVFPEIVLSYVVDEGNAVDIDGVYNANTKTITFNGIPFGAIVSLSVGETLQMGLSVNGWRSIAGSALSQDYYQANSTSLIIWGAGDANNKEGVRYDEHVIYELSYLSYKLQVLYSNTEGSPVLYLNNVETSLIDVDIVLFDKIIIQSNPRLGFLFDSFLKVYKYDETDWNENWQTKYILTAEGIKLNQESEYKETNVYLEKFGEYYVDGFNYVDDMFDIANFKIENNNIITIHISYDMLQMSIQNTTLNYTSYGTTNTIQDVGKHYPDNEDPEVYGRINIGLDEYANYEVFKKVNQYADESDPTAWTRLDLEHETINYYDKIKIYIQINTTAVNDDEHDKSIFDLTKGLKLIEYVEVAGTIFNKSSGHLVDNGGGNYVLTFEVSEIIQNVDAENPIVGIKYYYELEEKRLEVTTNISADSFYKKGSTKLLNITINTNIFKFGSSQQSLNVKEKMAKVNKVFLSKARISYDLMGYKNTFRVSKIKIYDNSGTLIAEPVMQEGESKESYNQRLETFYQNFGVDIEYDTDDGKSIKYVYVRFVDTIRVALQLQPIVYFDGEERISNYEFHKTYLPDDEGIGMAQTLSTEKIDGINIKEPTKGVNISSSSLFIEAMEITYYTTGKDKVQILPTNAGRYFVEISFKKTDDYAWLNEVEFSFELFLVIEPKEIEISYSEDLKVQVEKTYNSSSEINSSSVLNCLTIIDNAGWSVNYLSQQGGWFTFVGGFTAQTIKSTPEGDISVIDADETLYYNVKLSNVYLDEFNTFNKNYKLTNHEIVIKELVKILKKEVIIQSGLVVYDKVHDGTTAVRHEGLQNIVFSGRVNNDELWLDESSKFAFDSADESKKIKDRNVLLTEVVLGGHSAKNYYIKPNTVVANKTIYPYEIRKEIEGYGVISVFNKRGLTNVNLVGLLPLNAELDVQLILDGSSEYSQMVRNIAKFLTRGNEFVVGYQLNVIVDQTVMPVNNYLYVSFPTVDRLTNVAYVTGQQSNSLNYDVSNGYVVVDLSQFNEEVDTLFITKSRTYLKWWQILLIVLSSCAIIVSAIVIFIVIRRRKRDKYSIHDTI